MAETPKESWYRILLSVYLQQERYKEALPVLEIGVDISPVKKFLATTFSCIPRIRYGEESICCSASYAQTRYA